MLKKDLRIFFCMRMRELFDWNVMDSYRVRCLNTYSSIKELCTVLENWLKGNVKTFDTIELSIDETKDKIEKDTLLDFSFYDKDLFLQDLDDLKKKGKPTKDKNSEDICLYTIHLLKRCIKHNKDTYLSHIYDSIKEIVLSEEELPDKDFKPVADRLDYYCEELACELLTEEFSERHLYNKFDKLYAELRDFEAQFDIFISKHGHNVPERQYKVLFRIYVGRDYSLCSIDGFSKECSDVIPANIKFQRVRNFTTTNGNCIFYRTEANAKDAITAITRAKEKLDAVLDKANLGYSNLDIRINKQALAIGLYGTDMVYLVRPITSLDYSFADDSDTVEKIMDKLQLITDNTNIDDSVKERIKASIRHLRMGNMETDAGQKLVNYWIALEFIFASPKASESTISRLAKNLVVILLSGYGRKRIQYLDDALHSATLLAEGEHWWEKDDCDLTAFISGINNQLLRYHLQDLKANLCNKHEDAKKFVEAHDNHVKWHVYRMYRYRNQLVHEAAIIPGIENITRNLHYYLVYLLNQVFGFFTDYNMEYLSMDSLFFEYQQRYKYIQEILNNKNITRKERLDHLVSVKVYQDMMKDNQ